MATARAETCQQDNILGLSSIYLHIVPCVEGFQVKLPIWLGSPQPQVDGVVGVKARDWVVICNRCHLQAWLQCFIHLHVMFQLTHHKSLWHVTGCADAPQLPYFVSIHLRAFMKTLATSASRESAQLPHWVTRDADVFRAPLHVSECGCLTQR